MDKNYLIVGQGIAGSMLSWQMLKREIPHKVLDNAHLSSSSKAAAGLINPITGRRYVKSWMIDELLPFADETYSELQQLLKVPIHDKRRILRTFHDQGQVNLWNESTSRPGYEPHVGQSAQFAYDGLVRKPLGFGVIEKASLVDINQLITSFQTLLQERQLYINGQFTFDNFNADSSPFVVQGETFTDIIFSEGYKVIENPFFKYLPFQPAKGESMLVKVSSPLPRDILRDNIFIVPIDEYTFWTGGGYDRQDRTLTPDSEWKVNWISKLDALLEVEYKVESHSVGVRPSVTDRRPLLGTHPTYRNLHLFNGMGTKGTSLSPYWSDKFVDYLTLGKPIADAVSLERFNI